MVKSIFNFNFIIDIPPENMFVINNEYEAENLLIYIEHNHLLNSKGFIFIAGDA